MAVQYKALVLGELMTNCYIVYDDVTKDAMLIDPAWDYDRIDRELTKLGVTLRFVFLTHGHADHSRKCATIKMFPSISAGGMLNSFPIRGIICPPF